MLFSSLFVGHNLIIASNKPLSGYQVLTKMPNKIFFYYGMEI